MHEFSVELIRDLPRDYRVVWKAAVCAEIDEKGGLVRVLNEEVYECEQVNFVPAPRTHLLAATFVTADGFTRIFYMHDVCVCVCARTHTHTRVFVRVCACESHDLFIHMHARPLAY